MINIPGKYLLLNALLNKESVSIRELNDCAKAIYSEVRDCYVEITSNDIIHACNARPEYFEWRDDGIYRMCDADTLEEAQNAFWVPIHTAEELKPVLKICGIIQRFFKTAVEKE